MEKKQIQVLIVVVCIALAIGITIFTNLGGSSSGGGGNKTMQLLCVNEDCLATYEVTREEFRELITASGQMPMMPGMGQMSLICKECDEETAYIAEVCEKCETVFLPDYESAEDFDRCPECGYSRYEESRK